LRKDKISPSGASREFWGVLFVEKKLDFMSKDNIFQTTRIFFLYFICKKNPDFIQKNHILIQLKGGVRHFRPYVDPPL